MKYNIIQYVNHNFDDYGNKMSTHLFLKGKMANKVWSPAIENELG